MGMSHLYRVKGTVARQLARLTYKRPRLIKGVPNNLSFASDSLDGSGGQTLAYKRPQVPLMARRPITRSEVLRVSPQLKEVRTMTESDEQAQVADSDDAVDEAPTAQREESLQDAPDRVEVDPPEDESSDSSTEGE